MGYYPLNTANREWKWHSNPRANLQACADACRNRKGCTGFEYANSGSDVGACAIYKGGDDDKADSVWYSCVKSTLPGKLLL